MTKIQICLPNRNLNGTVSLDTKWLKIGNVIYLRLENDNVVAASVSEGKGFSPYIIDRVYAVTPVNDNNHASTAIRVQNQSTVLETLLSWTFWDPESIVEATSQCFDKESINVLAKKVIERYELKKIIKRDFIYNTPLRRIMTVARRICFCRAQATMLEYFLNGIDVNNSKNTNHSKEQLLALRWNAETESQILYLLLTCFDILGQQDNFLPFEDWALKLNVQAHPLTSKITASNFRETVLALKEEYLNDQGVSRRFKQYLLTELPAQARDELFASVCKAKREFHPNDSGHRLHDADNTLEKKAAILFDLRNNFTHQGRDVRSAIFFRTFRNNPLLKKHNREWLPIDVQVNAGSEVSINVKGWPDPLYKAVTEGLIKQIQDLISAH